MCGAATESMRDEWIAKGLSPRVRGSRLPALLESEGRGSIPACAGQPAADPENHADRQVYPRVCGAAYRCVTAQRWGPGLSPRVRGSPCVTLTSVWCSRSIPACAGQPFVQRCHRGRCWVYPRVCGAATRNSRLMPRSSGLSPRVRGSQEHPYTNLPTPRSIPACAGQPPACGPSAPRGSVYPRVCGAAKNRSSPASMPRGLSPRVRGSLPPSHSDPRRSRSIPACAGQPAD